MNWFSKIGRNTTGTNLSGSAGLAGSENSVRPKVGTFQPHAALPPAARLNARVDNIGTSGVALNLAKEYLAQVEKPFEQHPGPLNARTDGRAKHFFKSAASALGTGLGIGRGRAPHQEGEWTRADIVQPVKLTAGVANPVRKVFETPAQRTARRDAQANITAKLTELTGESRIALRHATDREAALSAKAAHVEGVRDTLLAGIQQARTEHAARLGPPGAPPTHGETLQDLASCRVRYEAAVEHLRTTGATLTRAEERVAHYSQLLQEADTKKASVRGQLQALQAQIATLPAAPPAGQPNPMVAQQLQAPGLLHHAQQQLANRQAALNMAETELKAAKKSLRRALIPNSPERALAKMRVQTTQQSVNNLIGEVATDRASVTRCQTNLDNANQAGLGQHQRALLEVQCVTLQRQLTRLENQDAPLATRSQARTDELALARTAHSDAQEVETTARIQMENADKAQAASRKRRDDLEREMPRVAPAAAALATPLHEARVEADKLRLQEQNRMAQKISALAIAPPGFKPTEVTPALQARIQALAARLDAVPADLNEEQAAAMRKFRMPQDQTLDIVSRALAKASGGDAAQAINILNDVTGRQFADLVPQPGMDYNGRTLVEGGPSDQGPVKQFASILAARPSGGEMLQRVTQPPATTPSRQLQDAVAVYYRATNALYDMPPADAQSRVWLVCAERASKLIAHPAPPAAPPPHAGTSAAGAGAAAAAHDPMDTLTGLERQAFNGVRNNLTSVAPGSPYDRINKSLKGFTEQWIPNGAAGNVKASPLHARKLATKVAADVGLPTNENGLHGHMKTACDKLLVAAQVELMEARGRVNAALEQNRSRPAGTPPVAVPQVPQSMLEAKHLLQYVQKRANRGERIDTMKLGSSAWRSINKKVQAELKLERAIAAGPQAGRDKPLAQQLSSLVAHVRSQPIGPGAERVLRPAPGIVQHDFPGVAAGLAALKSDKPTVLEALNLLGNHFRTEFDALAAADPTRGSRSTDGSQRLTDNGDTLDLGGDDHGPDDDAEHAVDNMIRRTEFMDVPEPAALAENAIETEEHALGGSSSRNPLGAGNPRMFQPQEGVDAILPDTSRGTFSMSRRPGTQGMALSTLTNLTNPLANPRANPMGGTTHAVSESGTAATTESRQERALGDAETALGNATTLKGHVDAFVSKKGDFSAAALEQWMIPSITNAFGGVTVSHGKQMGLGTGGVVGVVSQISGAAGLVIRPNLEVEGSFKDQFGFGRDALGVELSVGRAYGKSVSGGFNAGLGFDIEGTSKYLGAGPSVTLNHAFSSSKSQGGTVMRAPKFDGKTHPELTRDFSEMVSSLLTWKEPVGQDGAQLYTDPLQALLDKHPTVSLSTVESAKTFSHTSSLNVVGFASPGGVVSAGGQDGGVAANASANIFAGVASSKTQSSSRYKTEAGTQGMVLTSKKSTYTLSGMGGFNQVFNVGNTPEAKLRARLAQAVASADWRRSSAQSGVDMVTMPDGSLAADRFVEYNNYEKFEKAVQPHWEKWIDLGIKSGSWPEGFPDTDKRIMVERTLNDFMAKAKESIKAGTVTLHENMDVKPEVGAQLSANAAQEELARLDGRYEDAMALQMARQKILAEDSSYQPFLLKAIVRSSISQNKGVNLALSVLSTKSASATHVYDWFPRLGT